MRASLILCVAFCSLALSGCSTVYSAYPLNTSEDAVEEPALLGEWKSTTHEDDGFCIINGDHNSYVLITSVKGAQSNQGANSEGDRTAEQPPKLLQAYQVTLVRLGDQLFADMVGVGQALNDTEIEPLAGARYHHIILELNLTDSDLGYSVLGTAAVKEASQQGYAPLSYVEIGDDILLTASTEELRWAVSHYTDRLFSDSDEHYVHLTDSGSDRPPSPCDGLLLH
jgi:hypothetical protein